MNLQNAISIGVASLEHREAFTCGGQSVVFPFAADSSGYFGSDIPMDTASIGGGDTNAAPSSSNNSSGNNSSSNNDDDEPCECLGGGCGSTSCSTSDPNCGIASCGGGCECPNEDQGPGEVPDSCTASCRNEIGSENLCENDCPW